MTEKTYPRWKYHPSAEPLLIVSAAQEEAIGPAWGESPAEFAAKTDAVVVAEPPKKNTGRKAGSKSA